MHDPQQMVQLRADRVKVAFTVMGDRCEVTVTEAEYIQSCYDHRQP